MRKEKETILIIDDEEAIRLSYSDYLQDRNYITLTAENGYLGLEAFQAEKVDLILADIRMPEMDGLELLKRVKELSPDMPVIVISGTGAISDVVEALRRGAWDYLLKPIEDFSVLSHAVDKALEKARLIRENREHQRDLEKKVKKRTKKLEEANKELADEISKRKVIEQELELSLEELETRNAELERFNYTVSHDLKSPLITINGFIGMLEKHLKSNDTEKIEKDMGIISESVNKAHSLLSDILAYSRTSHQDTVKTEFPFQQILDEVINNLKGVYEDLSSRITIIGEVPTVYGECSAITEVLQNLLSNAARYSGNPDELKIEIGFNTIESSNVIYVKDNGIGIPANYQHKIFGLFERLDATGEGNGIGLSIAKRIINKHGGEIWVSSDGANQGSTFYFSLPMKPSGGA